MPKAVTKTIVRATMAVATGGISEAVAAGQAAAKGDITSAVTGLAGGLGTSSAIASVVDTQRKVAQAGKQSVSTVASAVSSVIPKDMKKTEENVEEKTRADERRRRAVLLEQGKLIRTSPLGAAIKDRSMLGGPKLAGY